jgi:hypothetical protein
VRQARPDGPYEIHLTYPVEDIDEARRKDWATEQGEERGRRVKNPVHASSQTVTGRQQPAGLLRRAPGHGPRVRVVDADAPHVIDLLQPLGM